MLLERLVELGKGILAQLVAQVVAGVQDDLFSLLPHGPKFCRRRPGERVLVRDLRWIFCVKSVNDGLGASVLRGDIALAFQSDGLQHFALCLRQPDTLAHELAQVAVDVLLLGFVSRLLERCDVVKNLVVNCILGCAVVLGTCAKREGWLVPLIPTQRFRHFRYHQAA
jgi:hypothetical protein